ncbi:MAG: hypothetical protein QNJ68_04845 [Microcoleaceae cyanobacterium MO_207.B10]|nr:hypothetical protein [Microcoleaceae cyanobacterium MO_207.B10]
MKSAIEITTKVAVKVKLACMSIAVTTLIFSIFSPTVFAQVEATVGDLIDYSDSLKVELKLIGDILVDAKAMRATVDRAVDDTGRSLIKSQLESFSANQVFENQFEEISSPGKNTTEIKLWLKNPTKRARKIQEISGTVEIFVPNQETKSKLTVKNLLQKIDVPIHDSILKFSGIEIVIKNPEVTGFSLRNGVALEIKDPDSKLVGIEFKEENGEVISPYGQSWSTTGDKDIRGFSFLEKLPPNAQLNLYILTPESVVKVPFKFVDVQL